ncbi:MAG TPA: CsbD family protein [Solirubrobacteraceae bacterium]|nr:CsbD family protein [Solirubrobacteraceae bacterium]
MSDKHTDEAKGRAKEAAGALTGDQSLKNEGKADQAKATIKDTVDKAADKAKDALDRDR